MNSFQQRKLSNTLTLGEYLQEGRTSRRITIEQAATDLKIRQDYIRALEQSEYRSLPSPVFIKNYVLKYTQYLRLSTEQTTKLLEEELKAYTPEPSIPILKGHLTKHPLRVAQVIGIVGVLLLILAVVTYVSFEISSTVQPPELVLESIPEKVSPDNRAVIISGHTVSEALVTINEQSVSVKEDGSFAQSVTLQSGVNLLKITVKMKRSREHVEYHQIVVEESTTDTPTSDDITN